MINDLTFTGENPVVINYNGSGEDIFAPIRTSSCDLNIVSPEILSDLYTARKDEFCVKIDRDIYDKLIEYIPHEAIYGQVMVKDKWIKDNEEEITEIVHHDAVYRDLIHPAWDETVYRTIYHSNVSHGANVDYDIQFADGRIINRSIADGYNSRVFKDYDGDLCFKGTITYDGNRDFFAVYDEENNRWVENNKWKLPDADCEYCFVELPYGNYVIFYYRQGRMYGWRSDYQDWKSLDTTRYYPLVDNFRNNYEVKGTHINTSGQTVNTDCVIIPPYWIGTLWSESNHTSTSPAGYDFEQLRYVVDPTSEYQDKFPRTILPKYFKKMNFNGNLITVYCYSNIVWQVSDVMNESVGNVMYMKYLMDMPVSGGMTFNDEDNNLYLLHWTGGYKYMDGQGFVQLSTSISGDDSDYSVQNILYTKTVDGDIECYLTNGHRYIIGKIWTEKREEIIHHPEWTEQILEIPAWDEEVKRIITTHIPHNAIYETRMISPAWTEEKVTRIYKETVPVWEGYMTPNLYSQELSQNLDIISMTAIDPVSIMKFIKLDKLFERPNVFTYKTILGRSLAYVKLDVNRLVVERSVSYGGDYDGFNGLLNLRCQISNFWDEGGEPSSVYEMIEEMLRPFSLSLSFTGTEYRITNPARVNQDRIVDVYTIDDNGNLTYVSMETEEKIDNDDWKDNNITSTNMSIYTTYGKVEAVSSTLKPDFSRMAMDLIDQKERDKYEAVQFNVNRNKTKGFDDNKELDDKDYWYYLWNGVYVNPDYGLDVMNAGSVNGWDNINKAYSYVFGDNGRPTEVGSVLNFYGGTKNASGTGKIQADERYVDIRKRITRFSFDNGVPPEFMEGDDFKWRYDLNYQYDGADVWIWDPTLTKEDKGSSRYGVSMGESLSSTITYHQVYSNMSLFEGTQQTLDFSLTHSYSRTGMDIEIPLMTNSKIDNPIFRLLPSVDESTYYRPLPEDGNAYLIPYNWLSQNIEVNYPWFNRYATEGRLETVWDKRRIDIYFTLEDGTVYQFNGKEWVKDTEVKESNAFYLKKLMNYEKIFHNDFKYNLIETSDGETYSLNEEEFGYRYEMKRRSSTDPTQVETVLKSGGSFKSFDYYMKDGNEWNKNIDDCGEGMLKIMLPDIPAINVTVITDVYNSTLLGSTGLAGFASAEDGVDYLLHGQGRVYDPETGDYTTVTISENNVGEIYNRVFNIRARYDMIPYSATYIKAEHLDLNIAVSVPQSNLGQVFSESDIAYAITSQDDYYETYSNLTFKVNTYNDLVRSSFSYLIFGNQIAEPNDFRFYDALNTRPETYTVQGYMNWLSKIRMIYQKTLVPEGEFGRDSYMTTPELRCEELMVVSDSVDLKSNRHSIVAVEDKDLDVVEVDSVKVTEVPRMARNERYNLPSVKK